MGCKVFSESPYIRIGLGSLNEAYRKSLKTCYDSINLLVRMRFLGS